MIGRTLSHYEITAKLGAGGMGEVYLARDTKLERQVALKVLPAELASDPVRLGRLQREAKALAALDHPNIVTIFSVEEADGIHFLTMAYVEGRTLDELIPPAGMSVERLLELAVALADALRAAHERGITHRDLKPSNVMVDEEGRLRVLDFGLARVEETVPVSSQLATRTAQEAMTLQGMVLGTIPYMSPEQAEGKPVGPSSDLFSLGIVLYEMATGSRPFGGDTAAALTSSILRDTPPAVTKARPEVPEPLGQLVHRCLEKVPEERPTTQAVRDELEELRHRLLSGAAVGSVTAARRLRSRAGWAAAVVVAVVLAAVVGTMAWRDEKDEAAGKSEPSEVIPVAPQIHSIAVLPLRNLSGDPGQEFFVDGMTEALITNLSKIGALNVIARSSAMRFKGTDTPLPEIAAALGVDAVVEGSVIREGEEVGISAQLIEAASERVLWGDQYTRDLTSVFALQRELARTIVGGIELSLTPQEEALLTATRPAVDPAAHEAYLRGRFHWYRFTPEDLASARRFFELALEIDPDFALAHVGLADSLSTPPHIGLVPPEDLFEQAKAAVDRALELDPDLAAAHDLRARIAFARDWDWERAERGFRRAIELNPSLADVQVVYSQFLAITGRWDQVLAAAERGVELDPLNPFSRQQLSERLSWLGRHDEAITGLEELVESGGDLPFVRRALWDISFARGDYERALAEARRYFQATGESELEGALGPASSGADYRAAMARVVEKMEERARQTWVAPTDLARLHAHAGHGRRALEWLERAYELPDSALVYATVDPVYQEARRDPRFLDLVRRMGLPATEREPGSSSG